MAQVARAMGLLLLSAILTACLLPAVTPTPSPREDPRAADLSARLEVAETELAATNERLRIELQELVLARKEASEQRALAERTQCCGTFPLWAGRRETIPPDTMRVVSVPDTFTLHLRFTATTPVRARIVTLAQFVRLMNGQTFDTAAAWGPTTSLDVDFHEAEGCAFYVLVLDAETETVLSPDISITRVHNAPPSGACR